jgi:hypothetical protein
VELKRILVFERFWTRVDHFGAPVQSFTNKIMTDINNYALSAVTFFLKKNFTAAPPTRKRIHREMTFAFACTNELLLGDPHIASKMYKTLGKPISINFPVLDYQALQPALLASISTTREEPLAS